MRMHPRQTCGQLQSRLENQAACSSEAGKGSQRIAPRSSTAHGAQGSDPVNSVPPGRGARAERNIAVLGTGFAGGRRLRRVFGRRMARGGSRGHCTPCRCQEEWGLLRAV